MTDVNSAVTGSLISSDLSSQLAEIRENYERKLNDLQSEFNQLKDPLMAVLEKLNTDSRN